jgi:hypothetical protein
MRSLGGFPSGRGFPERTIVSPERTVVRNDLDCGFRLPDLTFACRSCGIEDGFTKMEKRELF